METAELAEQLLDRAIRDEQVAHRIQPGDDVALLRRSVRQRARDRSIRIRTAVVDGVLVVVRLDAQVWTDDTATMRTKLTPAGER